MATFSVHTDITFSGDIEVNAETEEQAKTIVKQMSFVPSNLKSCFYHFSTDIADVEKV